MSSATEMLCGQAYGAKQYHMMGIYLQRSRIIDLITLLVLLPVFIFGTQIFDLLGQEDDISKPAGYISLWFIPFVVSLIFSLTVQMYLQAQQKNIIIAWLSAVQFVIHILFSRISVYVLDFGASGAMAALNISSWFLVFGECVYIFGGWCPETWKGFILAALKDLWPVVKLSVSSGLMVCLNINAWILMITLGIMGAACVRVANELGSGDARAVRFSIKVLMSTSVSLGLFFWIIFLVFSNHIGYLFSNDQEVVDTISSLSLLLAFSVLLGIIYPVLSGIENFNTSPEMVFGITNGDYFS